MLQLVPLSTSYLIAHATFASKIHPRSPPLPPPLLLLEKKTKKTRFARRWWLARLLSETLRMARDIRPAVPRNAGRVICGNCDTPFVFKEYESTVVARSAWEGEIAALDATVEQAERAYDMAVVNRDKARLEVSTVIMLANTPPGVLIVHT